MSTALVNVEAMTAVEIFRPGAIDPLLGAIREEVRQQASKLDISTEPNRKAIASLAFKVAKSKTFIDGQRKSLVADEKKRLAAIDAEGRRIWDELEALQDEVRKPLTDWEQADKDRLAAHEAAIAGLEFNAVTLTQNWQTADLDDLRAHLEVRARDWQEFSARGSLAESKQVKAAQEAIAKREKYDAEQAELVRLRAEAEARERQEREERIAQAARERAEREAKEREEAIAKQTEADRLAMERRREEAEARARRAEEARKAAEEKAQRDAADAAERAEREKQAAVEAERQRVAAEEQRNREEAERREANKKHRAKIQGEAVDALMRLDIPANFASAIIQAIASGKIPHVTIAY